ncbi:MAG: hypothetical protein CMG00_05905, partial [Candidatus Marinimicrobia bacterium]|nr:hypothetical protein [Candidatus Neomarinimicrobiota bacterium]
SDFDDNKARDILFKAKTLQKEIGEIEESKISVMPIQTLKPIEGSKDPITTAANIALNSLKGGTETFSDLAGADLRNKYAKEIKNDKINSLVPTANFYDGKHIYQLVYTNEDGELKKDYVIKASDDSSNITNIAQYLRNTNTGDSDIGEKMIAFPIFTKFAQLSGIQDAIPDETGPLPNIPGLSSEAQLNYVKKDIDIPGAESIQKILKVEINENENIYYLLDNNGDIMVDNFEQVVSAKDLMTLGQEVVKSMQKVKSQ